MLHIEPHQLRWLPDSPPETDLCAHGGVLIRNDATIIVDQRAENWTLSASAVYLLRTLTSDHTPDRQVGDHLFPCCGHAFFPTDDPLSVYIVGCPHGFDFEVRHEDEAIRLSFPDGQVLCVSHEDWLSAVLRFVAAVDQFYANSAPKAPGDPEETANFAAFRAEWALRLEQATD